MQDITFNFSKIGEEELKLVSGGVELNQLIDDLKAVCHNYGIPNFISTTKRIVIKIMHIKNSMI
ncbi:MAG: hypothetical protein K5654_08010 [Lachnospiraceae bacterium]|nr:hypothetical protein [Lachnospiraceae bacterium]